MATYPRYRLTQHLATHSLVPVFYHADPDLALAVVNACYAGGVRAFEFTNRGDFAHEVFRKLRLATRETMPDLALGAGTITDGATAALYLQQGADFIVGPAFSAEVALICNRRNIAYLPGCLTLTEITNAYEYGVDIVKVFPGSALGAGYVKAILGPLPHAQIMPTGGVEPTTDSINLWFKAGVFCVGIGSQLFPAKLDDEGLQEVSERCKTSLQAIDNFRAAQ